MHQIAKPTDFAGTSRNAVDYVFPLFKGEPSAFHFGKTRTVDFTYSPLVVLYHMDCIIPITSGACGLKEVFQRSNTARILKSAGQWPVLVTPNVCIPIWF